MKNFYEIKKIYSKDSAEGRRRRTFGSHALCATRSPATKIEFFHLTMHNLQRYREKYSIDLFVKRRRSSMEVPPATIASPLICATEKSEYLRIDASASHSSNMTI